MHGWRGLILLLPMEGRGLVALLRCKTRSLTSVGYLERCILTCGLSARVIYARNPRFGVRFPLILTQAASP